MARVRRRASLRRDDRHPRRALPHDFTVSWSAAHKHFTRWTRRRLWEQVLAVLRAEDRVHDGRDQQPTAAVVDSSSVKSTPVPGQRGFDGAKKVDGIKRHSSSTPPDDSWPPT